VKAWETYVMPTIIYSLAFLFLIVAGSLVPCNQKLLFSTLYLPIIFILTAFTLASVTKTSKWASLRGRGFTVRVAGVYLFVCFLIMLVQRPLAAAYLQSTKSQLIQGMQLVHFRRPHVSPGFLRSVVGSPISEEILFRGWLLTWFRNQNLTPVNLGTITVNSANLLTSLSFALLHITSGWVVNVIGVFFISLLLGSARLRSGGILLPILCHALINFMNESYFVWVP